LDLRTLDGWIRTTVMRTSKGRYYCRLLAFHSQAGHYHWVWNYPEAPTPAAAIAVARRWIRNYEKKTETRLCLPNRTEMTKLLYQTDSYIQEFDATVTAVDETAHAVALNQTCFFPGGGGQQADAGTLRWCNITCVVERAIKNPAGVWHNLEGAQALPNVGERVHAQLDWARRYAIMRTHTAMHILCGVVFRDFGALVTGGDMEPLKGRMDFEFESMTGELVQVIEQAVNAEVAAARPVRVQILPREQAFQIPDLIRTKINLLPEGIREIRTVEIVGLDLQADGGTHVHNTAEVGRMRIVDYKSKGKINKRIYVELD
jgi:misacylated tRNA(Ala) deacylase